MNCTIVQSFLDKEKDNQMLRLRSWSKSGWPKKPLISHLAEFIRRELKTWTYHLRKNNACKVRPGVYSARFNAARGPLQNNALVSHSFCLFLVSFASCWFLLVQSGTCLSFNSLMKLSACSTHICRCSVLCLVSGAMVADGWVRSRHKWRRAHQEQGVSQGDESGIALQFPQLCNPP